MSQTTDPTFRAALRARVTLDGFLRAAQKPGGYGMLACCVRLAAINARVACSDAAIRNLIDQARAGDPAARSALAEVLDVPVG